MSAETEIPAIMAHVSVGTNRFAEAIKFYDEVLKTVGAKRIWEAPGVEAIAYGKEFPEFWVQAPIDGKPASAGNGTHFCFLAKDKDAVDAFYAAALAGGAKPDGEPGGRPHYGEAYYGCFVRDLDGHKIEAMYWDLSKDQNHPC